MPVVNDVDLEEEIEEIRRENARQLTDLKAMFEETIANLELRINELRLEVGTIKADRYKFDWTPENIERLSDAGDWPNNPDSPLAGIAFEQASAVK